MATVASNIFSGEPLTTALDSMGTMLPGEEIERRHADDRIASEITRISNSMSIPAGEKADYIARLQDARTSGNPSKMLLALAEVGASVKTDAQFDSPTIIEQEAVNAARLARMSQNVNIGDSNAVRSFFEDVTKTFSGDLPESTQKMIAEINAANPDKTSLMLQNASDPAIKESLYAKAQTTDKLMDQLDKDPAYSEEVKALINKAQSMGLIADKDVQELMKRAAEHSISEDELKASLQTEVKLQLQAYNARLTEERARLSPELQEALNHIGDGSNKAVYERYVAEVEAMKKYAADHKNSLAGYEFSSKESEAAVIAIAAAKNESIVKIISSDAIAATYKLERADGLTYEERLKNAVEAVKEHLPPELANIPGGDATIRTMVDNAMKELDKRNINIKDADQLSGAEMSSFATQVGYSTLSSYGMVFGQHAEQNATANPDSVRGVLDKSTGQDVVKQTSANSSIAPAGSNTTAVAAEPAPAAAQPEASVAPVTSNQPSFLDEARASATPLVSSGVTTASNDNITLAEQPASGVIAKLTQTQSQSVARA